MAVCYKCQRHKSYQVKTQQIFLGTFINDVTQIFPFFKEKTRNKTGLVQLQDCNTMLWYCKYNLQGVVCIHGK